MNFGVLEAFNLIGALGLFLFGMSMMSEALQKVAGNKLRAILASMTKNRFMGVLTGVVITSIIQSSSATTVMTVSFVNAGLLSLAESITVIMGANIGTTITAWMVSLVGFKFSIATIAIPLIGVAMPFIFSKNDKRKSIGQLLIGFSLLFLGLEYLKNGVPDLKSNPEILAFIQNYTNMGYGSLLLFLLFGTILTVVVQSSSATMAITLVMLSQNWITFEIGAAIVLGENIGTTITANIAALTANANAKRTALSHTLFNIFGVIWVLILFYPFLDLVKWIVNFGDEAAKADNLFALSMFHTLFNITNTLIMVWFVRGYEKLVCKIMPTKGEENEFNMQFITSGMLNTGELSLLEAEKEVVAYTERTHRMFTETKNFALASNKDKEFANHAERLAHYESSSDQTEIAIGDYLYKVSSTPISSELKSIIRNYLYLTTEIESVADRCFNMSRTTIRRNTENIEFTDLQKEEMTLMFNLVDRQLTELDLCVKSNFTNDVARKSILQIEEDINQARYEIKIRNVANIKDGKYSYVAGTYFMDIIEECESLADAISKIAKEVILNK